MERKISFISLPVICVALALSMLLPSSLIGQSPSGFATNKARLDGAAKSGSAEYLSAFEQDVLNEMNLARANPVQYATYLEQLKRYYKGNRYAPPGQREFVTNEGVGAVDEAIKFLRAAKPVAPLSASKGMSLGAKDHVKDLGLTGSAGHKGTDGSMTGDRVNRYGMWTNAIGENIAYSAGNARDAVVGFIIDDGLQSRAHRLNLFNPNYRMVGVALGQPGTYGSMCVVTFAGGYAEKAIKPAPLNGKPAPAKGNAKVAARMM
ncbi:MAG: CAP domain-containing protein [Pyrinomonadaceae bacterium]